MEYKVPRFSPPTYEDRTPTDALEALRSAQVDGVTSARPNEVALLGDKETLAQFVSGEGEIR